MRFENKDDGYASPRRPAFTPPSRVDLRDQKFESGPPPAESPLRTQKAGVLHSDFCEFIAWWVSVGPPPHISSSSRGSGTPITLATSRLISVAWDDWEYGHGAVGCGAAHPNSHAKVETLMLSPVPHSMQPSDLFRQRRYGPNKVAP